MVSTVVKREQFKVVHSMVKREQFWVVDTVVKSYSFAWLIRCLKREQSCVVI